MIDFSGKRGLVLGVGNQRSIAWAIVEQLHALGADLGLTYLSDPKGRFEANVRKLGDKVGASIIQECDVANDESIQQLIETTKKEWGELDFLVHSLAFADYDDLNRPYSETSRTGFMKAHDISAFSLLPLSNGVAPMMRKRGGGSILSISFIGAVLAVPNYNVMGAAKAALEASTRYLARQLGPENIRANTISAGAIRTLSASGIKNFSEMLRVAGEHSAMHRTVTQDEVGKTAAFLLSDVSSGITGQTVYVDCGYSIMAN
ncbi:MAG: enoyl-ACP reductase [SAR324 cluster bacterium]|nr:enoyl-ACP reductase [SAR324 cluster bacterium]